jgi:hypothetical protein
MELIGEKESSLLFNKGVKENLNLSKFLEDFLIVTFFGYIRHWECCVINSWSVSETKTILEQ